MQILPINAALNNYPGSRAFSLILVAAEDNSGSIEVFQFVKTLIFIRF